MFKIKEFGYIDSMRKCKEYASSRYISKEPKPKEQVTCEDCKCLLYKEDAQRIRINGFTSSYYCGKCRKPYDSTTVFLGQSSKYYKEIEVDEKGEPVGYKKIKGK